MFRELIAVCSVNHAQRIRTENTWSGDPLDKLQLVQNPPLISVLIYIDLVNTFPSYFKHAV
jgi:hypothetical protein